MKKNIQHICTWGMLVLLSSSCTKDILDRKPNKSQVVPTTIADFQAILDNVDVVFATDYIELAEVGAGDFYLTDADYLASTYFADRNGFTWQRDVWQGSSKVPDWNSSYNQVFYTNVVLDGLPAISVNAENQAAYNNVKGMALFLRAEGFYNVAQLFAMPYDPATAGSDGIPLRLNPDLNIPSARSTVQQTYDQITNDLTQAAQLLPVSAVSQYRANKPAAFALLARVYLAMGKYDEALKSADACLKLYSSLLDYNSLTASATYPIPVLNNEIIYYAAILGDPFLSTSRMKIDPVLYQSYAANDLRRTMFFQTNTDGTIAFKGVYTGFNQLFSGMTTDEQFLIRAEGYARAGNMAAAMSDLNTLLVKRFKTGTFVPYTAGNANDALKQIITERRKELLLRGLRWSDLRRLNKESQFAVTLSKTLGGVTYTLMPNDARYILPIPDYIIAGTGMPQNPR
jgi:tetratricopeptide (TPR) repeat protein